MELVNGLILAQEFSHFISEFSDFRTEDMEWEYFLHKVFDKSFNEFRDSISLNAETTGMSKPKIEATIRDSMNMAMNFIPED